MKKIRPYRLLDHQGNTELGYRFWCPACAALHAFCVKPYQPTRIDGEPASVWEFTGTYQEPTVTPSIHYTHRRGNWLDTQTDPGQLWLPYGDLVTDCHLTITAGRIYYHGDCPHEFKGETIDMVEFPDSPSEQDALAHMPAEFFRRPRKLRDHG